MDFEIGQDPQGLRDAVRRVLEAECPLSAARAVVETGHPAAEPWASAASECRRTSGAGHQP